MHTVKIVFEYEQHGNFESTTESVNVLLGVWRMNGQILGEQFPIARTENGLEVYVNAPDADSFSEKYNNQYVNKYLTELKEKGVVPKIAVLGKEPDSATLCACEEIKSFILFTTYVSLESPLKCANCFGVVPLYKIPATYADEYYNIICWQSDFQSCDSLQMQCAVGERFATNQISKPDSQLTKFGFKVCRSIEKVTNKKVFYYLYKGSAKSYQSELLRKCPNCNGDWHLKKSLHGIFDFKCKKCQLLSNIAWEWRP